MREHAPHAPAGPAGSVLMPPAEKLRCEREARHDVAARGRAVDPAAALRSYLTHARVDEELRHHDRVTESPPARPADPRDTFAKEHPLIASWLRWGEPPR